MTQQRNKDIRATNDLDAMILRVEIIFLEVIIPVNQRTALPCTIVRFLDLDSHIFDDRFFDFAVHISFIHTAP